MSTRFIRSAIVLLFLTFIVNIVTNAVIIYHFPFAVYPKTTAFLILIDILLDIIIWAISDYGGYYRSIYLTLLYIWVFGFTWVAVDTYKLVAAWFATGAIPAAGLCWMLLLTLAVTAGIYLCARHYFLESMDHTEALWER